MIAVLVPNKPFWGARIVQVPFLWALRKAWPGEEIRLHAPVGEAREFLGWALADSWRPYGRAGGPGALGLVRALRAEEADRVYNLRRKSGACVLATALAPGSRIGFDEGLGARRLHERRAYDSHI
jgi:hypothetical protein